MTYFGWDIYNLLIYKLNDELLNVRRLQALAGSSLHPDHAFPAPRGEERWRGQVGMGSLLITPHG